MKSKTKHISTKEIFETRLAQKEAANNTLFLGGLQKDIEIAHLRKQVGELVYQLPEPEASEHVIALDRARILGAGLAVKVGTVVAIEGVVKNFRIGEDGTWLTINIFAIRRLGDPLRQFNQKMDQDNAKVPAMSATAIGKE